MINPHIKEIERLVHSVDPVERSLESVRSAIDNLIRRFSKLSIENETLFLDVDEATGDEIARAIVRQVSQSGANSFAHLWQDGIYKASQDREPDILRRKRLLATLSRVLRNDRLLNLENIVTASKQSSLNSAEILPTLNDFARRNILREKDGVYEFVLPIFRLWLNEVGTAEFASDAIGEELARSVQASEDAAYVKPSEVEAAVQKWPLYQGRRVAGESVRAWLNQVQNNRQRRLLFTLLKNLAFFDEQKIRQSLKTAHGIIRPSLPQFIQRRRSQRRTDLVVTYVDGEGKSGQYYASKYAEENGIGTQSIISPADFENRLRQHQDKHGKVAAIVIIDDIVATGASLARNLLAFCDENRTVLQSTNVPVTAVALVSTPAGEQHVRRAIQSISWLDLDFRVCDFLLPNAFAFGADTDIWETLEDRDEARALCEDIGARIYPDNPLGYGGQALLVVFPDTCPNNTVPILHSSGSNGDGNVWKPLFQRLVN